MVTLKDISKKCSVSLSTVSKVMNGYTDISDVTKELVTKTAKEMGYETRGSTKFWKKRKTYQLGVLFSTMGNQGLKNEYFAYILTAFRQQANDEGYDVTFLEHNVGRKSMTYLEHCRSRSFDGVCIACTYFLLPEILELASSEFPVVTIDHAYNNTIGIMSDNIRGMKDLTEYVVAMGHKKIAYIRGTQSVVTHNRVAAFNSVLQEHGITVPDKYMPECEYTNANMAESCTEKLIDMPDRPTCILAPDDFAALGVIRAIRRRGLRVPEDISVAGYDGISISQTLVPKLTTVRQNSEKIGMEAARKLIRLIESPMTTTIENCLVRGEFIEGESVAKLLL